MFGPVYPPLQLFDRLGNANAEQQIDEATRRNGGEGVDLCCRHCTQAITSNHARVNKRGHHSHVFTNPHGQRFEIGCFSHAAGCLCRGEAHLEHTWFPGYAWRIALCNRCGSHLGWRFEDSASMFYGLILAELTECGGTSPH